MEKIPVRQIKLTQTQNGFSESFSIRDVKELLAGKDMVQELHRHDYFHILALQKGTGDHEIDFKKHKVGDNSVFFLRPGQVHQLTLKSDSTGYLIQFQTDFYHPRDKLSRQLMRKASNKNFSQLDASGFTKLLAALTYMSREYASKPEGYQEVIKANMGI